MHRKAKGENPPPSIMTNQASPDDIFSGSKQKRGWQQRAVVGPSVEGGVWTIGRSQQGCERLSSEFTFSKADQGPPQTGRRDSCGRESHTNLKRVTIGCWRENYSFFSFLVTLPKGRFFIDSRAREVKLNKIVLSVAEKSFNKTAKT